MNLGLKDFGKHDETLNLRGLDPDAKYSIREINCGESLHGELSGALFLDHRGGYSRP